MTVTSDSMPIFPECPTYGFQVNPLYRVKIVEREGGHERRDRKWSRPLHLYTAVPMGIGGRKERDIQSVYYFWHAMGGMAETFRFKDWNDYKSCKLHETTSILDQPFSPVSGSPGGYQLMKQYIYSAAFTQLREIYKPVGSTIRVSNHLGVEQVNTRWTIEEGTGLLVPNGSFVGTPGAWGGEFYVPVRFASELDIELTDYKIQNCSFSLKEVRVTI